MLCNHMKCAAYMAIWFITFFHVLLVPFFIDAYGCMFRMFLFKFENYVFLVLCLYILIVKIMYSFMYVLFCILFHYVVLCIFCV